MAPDSDEQREGNYNALEVLQEDQANIRALLDELLRQTAPENARIIFAQLYNEVVLHATIAADIFYPNLRYRLDQDALIERCADQLQRARDLLESAVYLAPDSADFKDATLQLSTQLETQFREENEALYPQVRARMSEAELEELAVVLEQSKGQVQHSHTALEDGGAMVRAAQP